MCMDALTGTEHIASDFGRAFRNSRRSNTSSDTNHHSGVILHTGNLTTTIDVSGSCL